MNHFVPEFDMDDYSIPSSSGHHHHRQRNMQEDEILELLWQNGQVVVQSQHPRSLRKPSPPPPPPPPPQEQQKHHQLPAPPLPTPPDTQLFMQEDEMISWLEYPSFDRDLADLLYVPPGPPPPSSSAPLRPPLPPAPAPEVNFPQFSRTTTRFPESGPSTSSRNNEMRGSTTVVDSSDTPAVRQKLKIPMAVEVSADRGNRWREIGGASVAGGGGNSMSMSREIDTCDLTQTSSPGGSGASLSATATADPMTLQPADDRKRKGRQQVDEVNADYSEDLEIESYEPKKQTRGAGNKRSRAAEVHNLSERRRRDRINEKMKVLQELIPRSSKTDKASMLDEAIDYLKSLQMQVQMMSMGCGMVPVMFPQQYMSSMGMGMGMGMGMEMGMNRPMMPFPGVLPGSAMPTPGPPSHLNPRFPLQAFQTPGDSSANPGHNMAMIPSLADAYQQQCMTMQQMPVQIPQNQLTRQPSASKQSANRGGEVHENHPTG